MPMARTRRGRMKQIENWLRARFPTPRYTRVRWVDMKVGRGGDFATTDRVGNEMVIKIHNKLTWYYAADTLFEEWAHAMVWPLATLEMEVKEHGPEWGLAYASIRHEFHDLEGAVESRDYPEN